MPRGRRYGGDLRQWRKHQRGRIYTDLSGHGRRYDKYWSFSVSWSGCGRGCAGSYQETTLTLLRKEFPAWQNTDNADYYVVYALNADGEKGLYQYDTVDKNYQHFAGDAGPADDGDSKKDSSAGGLWRKVLDFLDIIVIIAAVVLLILLIMLIVTAVKLHHRDLELDDFYDEYGIDLDEEEDFDNFEDYEEEDDEIIDDLGELLSSQPKKKWSHMDPNDTFKVDFIDLD